MIKRIVLTLLLAFLLTSPLLAQVDSTNIPADTPRLQAMISPAIVWGAACLFSLLVLIMAFKSPKRTFYDRKE